MDVIHPTDVVRLLLFVVKREKDID